MAKLFIGGVSPNTTGEAIQDFFSKFGAVADAVVMRDRGFGFVTFESESSAREALREPQQTIDGQTVDVKPAVGKGGGGGKGGRDGGKGGGGGAGPTTDKVFVGGLPQDCSDDIIRDYFGQYGHITDAVVMKDRETGRSRGFGFVQFDTPDAVDKVMAEYSDHKIEGKWVEVKRSVPRDQMAPPGPSSKGGGRGDRDRDRRSDRDRDRDDRGGSAYGGGAYGGGYPGYPGGYPGYPAYPGYPGYPPAYGGYPGYSMPPPQGYPGYDPYAAYGAAYGAAPPGKGAPPPRSSPY